MTTGCQQKSVLNKIIGTEANGLVKTITVLPNNLWTDTGITVKSGQRIKIEASGNITVDNSIYAAFNSKGCVFTPVGSLGTSVQNLPNVPGWVYYDAAPVDNAVMYTYCLVGQTKSESSVYNKFYVGNTKSSDELSGKLYLAVNTWTASTAATHSFGAVADTCSGAFQVKIWFD